jgi:hypothetical protein
MTEFPQGPEPLLTREELARVLKIHPRSVRRHYLKPCGKIIPGARGERYSWQEVNQYLGASRPKVLQGGLSNQARSPGRQKQGAAGGGAGDLDPNRHGLLGPKEAKPWRK